MTGPACDRCGTSVPKGARTRRTLHLTTHYSRRHLRQRMDLCADCRTSFGDWLHQPLAAQPLGAY